MPRRCSTDRCPKPRANWWRQALSGLSSSQGVPANAVLYEDSSVAYHEDSSIVTYES